VDATLAGDVAGEEVHLIGQDVPIAEDQVLGLIRNMRRIEELHARLLRSATGLALVTRATGGDDVHPDIATTLDHGYDVVAGQSLAGEGMAAVATSVAVALEEFAVRERGGLKECLRGECLAANGDDAVRDDLGTLA